MRLVILRFDLAEIAQNLAGVIGEEVVWSADFEWLDCFFICSCSTGFVDRLCLLWHDRVCVFALLIVDNDS